MMFNIPTLICFGVSALVIAVLLIDNVRIRFKNRKFSKIAQQALIDQYILATEIQNMIDEKDTKSVEETDGFLKFVSESRDWAFDYIEKVQVAIEALRIAIDSDDAEADIETAYENVISFLPENLDS